MVLALSVSSEIKTVGSYAGLAALLGLAILALLYFAQARETRRVAEWIEREEQRRASVPVPVAVAASVPAQAPVARSSAPAPGPPPPTGAAITTAVPGVRRVAVPPAAAVAGAASSTSVVATAAEIAPAPRAPEETTRIVAMPIAAPATPAAAGLATPAVQEPTEAPPSETAPVNQTPTQGETASQSLSGEQSPARELTPASDPPASERAVFDGGPDTGEMDAADLPSAAVPLVAEPSPSAEPRRVAWPLAAQDDPASVDVADHPQEASVPQEPELADEAADGRLGIDENAPTGARRGWKAGSCPSRR